MRRSSNREYSGRELQQDSLVEARSTVFERDVAVTGSEEIDPMIPAVEFRNVSFSYDDKTVLNDLSFKLEQGEIKIILSGSGGGKSTILKLILGLLKPDKGQIFIDGEDIAPLDEDELQRARDKMGMVFQEGALFDSLSVYENVAFRLQEHEVPEKEIEEEVRSLLKFVKLEDAVDKLPSELSGGMRKRLSIARALVGNPKIVLFDEPTVALDPPTSGTICDLIIELRDLENVSSIVVTHEMDVVKYLTSEYVSVDEKGKLRFREDRQNLCLTNTNILMLRRGREIFSGTGTELIESEDPYIREFIRGTEMLPEDHETENQ
ncbi:MAG: organic solvent resistance ABC transporter ATP-binding protein [Acidobacteria bacterium]|nr:MAG: organic solvent resistance ABC transporter ATP-binding protein [Acidobacteriota bacterium]